MAATEDLVEVSENQSASSDWPERLGTVGTWWRCKLKHYWERGNATASADPNSAIISS